MLAERLWKQPLSVAEAGPVIAGVIDEVAALHGRGEVDGALHPSRVIVTADGMRLAERAPRPWRSDPPDLADFDAALGRFPYMAPEQVRGSATVDGRADIYAIGALAFRALTGASPFSAVSALTLIALKLDRPAPTLQSVAGHAFPPLAESFVATAMDRDRDRRYRSIGVAREAWRLVCSAG